MSGQAFPGPLVGPGPDASLVDAATVSPQSDVRSAADRSPTLYLQRTARGSAARVSWLVAGALLAVPATALLVRSLGVRSYGTLSLGLTIIALASVVADLGIGSGVTRMAAFERGEAADSWARAGIHLAWLSGLGFAVAVGIAGIVIGGTVGGIIALLSPTVLLAALISVATGYLRTRQRVFVSELATSGQQTLYSAAGIALAAAGIATVWSVAGAALIIEAFAACAAWLAWRTVIGRIRTGRLPHRRILHFSLPLLAAAASTLALQSSDVLLLGVFRGPIAVGLYYPVLRMVNLSALALSAVGQYFLPVATSILAAKDMPGLRSFYTTVTKWEIAVLGPPLITLVIQPRPLIVALFGAPFGASVWVARVLALGYLVNVLTGHNGMVMVALGMTKQIGIRSALSFFASIAVNLALIPAFGMLGAALGTSLVYVGLNTTNAWFVWKAARIVPVRRDVIAVVCALAIGTGVPAVVMAAAGMASIASMLIVLAVGSVASVGAAAFTSSADEKDAFRSLFARAQEI
jgi:O-antigen/teichoic acid export membrane protein